MNISKVGIIGAGTMGNGIAQSCAAAGLSVVMLDIKDEVIQRGLASISGNLERLLKKEKITAADKDALLARIQGSTRQADFADCQLVIEAATENQDLKLRLLQEVENHIGAESILASNTSSISITRLAASLKHSERFIGMHFFNPVPVMALVEVIRGLQTTDAVHDEIMALARRLGKTPISIRNNPGFVVNRILCPMLNEAIFVLAEGLASAEDIDSGMKLGCNHPIGPLALADMVGLDVLLSVMEVLYTQFNDSKYRPAPLLREMVAAGYLGRKTGRGFFNYN